MPSSQPGPSVNLSPSLVQTVLVQSPDGNPIKGLILNNETGLSVIVTYAGGTKVLSPWYSDYFPLTNGISVQFAIACSSTAIGSVSSGQMTSTIINVQDQDPTGYPMANPLGALAAISGSVALPQDKLLGLFGFQDGVTFNVTIPSGIQSLYCELAFMTVTGGVTSGNFYIVDVEPPGGPEFGARGVLSLGGVGSLQAQSGVWLDCLGDGTAQQMSVTAVPAGVTGLVGEITIFGYGLPAAMVRPNAERLWLPYNTNGGGGVFTGSTGNIIAMTGAFQTLVGPPPNGFVRTVDTFNLIAATAGDTIDIGINAAVTNYAVQFQAGLAPLPTRWKIYPLQTGIQVRNVTAARGDASASWYDEITIPL